jgi:ABC-type Fe3+ transport system substrate-binding protein
MKTCSRLMIVMMVAVMSVMLAACGSDPTPTPTPLPTATATAAPSGPAATPTPDADAVFAAEWESLIAEAKAEGKLSLVFGGSAGRNYRPLIDHFQEKFGIEVIFSPGSGSKQTARVLVEQAAGEFLVDVLMIGGTSAQRLTAANGLQPIKEWFMHPDILDESGWYKGQLWYTDAEQRFVLNNGASAAPVNLSMRYNTDLVTQADIDGWESIFDFLDPKWAGKIVALTPETGGAGGTYYGLLANPFVDAEAFLTKLYDPKMDVFFTEDFRLIADGVANGKFAFGILIGSAGRDIDKLKELGLPVEELIMELKEGFDLSGAGSGDNIMVPINTPHPAAAKLFLNWFLSREGQTAKHHISDGNPNPSLRQDIPCDGNVKLANCRVEGKDYFYPTTDPAYTGRRDEFIQLSRDMFQATR